MKRYTLIVPDPPDGFFTVFTVISVLVVIGLLVGIIIIA